MKHRRALTAYSVVVFAGCAYAQGSIDYAANPELRNLRLYTGRPDPAGESLAIVTADRQGAGDCSDLAAHALLDLLAQANAVGGDAVKDVKFRGRWNWMGRVVCRRGLAGKSVHVRGISYRVETDK